MVTTRFTILIMLPLACCIANAADSPKASKDSEKPGWSVKGRVVDGDGNAMPDVTVSVHTGIGTLSGGGKGTTDKDGKFEVAFGTGVRMANDDVQMQYATVYAHKRGFFEKNLCRHGGLAMALRIPDDFKGWGGLKKEDIILPGEPRELNFQLLPATSCRGTVVDENGKPMSGYKVSLKGEDMPPSSSVAASARADEQGKFHLESIPTGFEYQILVRPANPAPPWNAWASGKLKFAIADADDATAFASGEDHFKTGNFEIKIKTAGVNWKRALQIGGAHQRIESDGETVRLELHPPGLPVAKVDLPK